MRALTYSVGATIIGALIVYAGTGNIVFAGEFAIADRIAKLLWYLLNDKLWELYRDHLADRATR